MKQLYLLISVLFCIPQILAQVSGCTDPLALNYNPVATENDGSCAYAALSVAPDSSVNLPVAVSETSGIIKWNNALLTHNDDTDTHLYAIDTASASVSAQYVLPNVTNIDWEDIAQDENFIYVGDFGNNSHGNRQNLRILRILKSSLSTSPVIDTIAFSYEDQTDFSSLPANTTDFDCEAMVASANYLYLFTKQWSSNATVVYRVPKLNGTHTALVSGAFDVDGLITGATYLENRRLLVLLGYTNILQPFVYLFYDFYDDNFFSANRRKIMLPLQFYQTEGIATTDGLHYWITNEKLVQGSFLNIPNKLHHLDLTPYLSFYINSHSLSTHDPFEGREFVVYPNPSDRTVTVKVRGDLVGVPYVFFNESAQNVLHGTLETINTRIDVSSLSAGVYHLQIGDYKQNQVNVLIK